MRSPVSPLLSRWFRPDMDIFMAKVLVRLGSGDAVVVLAVAVVLLVDFLRLPRSSFFTWRRAVLLYLLRRLAIVVGFFKWRQLVKDSKSLLQVQEEFVLRQVAANASSAYGRDHGFSEIRSLADFRRKQPVTSYSDYESYVERVERGEATALFADGRQPGMFGCSSGTTGKSKLIPVSARGLDFTSIVAGFYGCQQQDLLSRTLRPQLGTFCAPRWRHTPLGVPIGSVMANAMKSAPATLASTLPVEAMTIRDQDASKYVGLLFGLRDVQVERVDGAFASGLFGLLQYLEQHWRPLVEDVRTGRLGDSVELPQEVRDSLNALLKPDPKRASQLEAEFSKGFENIIPRIFPHADFISSNCSGSSMAVYKKRCRHYIGDLPIHSPIYICTEGLLGVNLRPGRERPGYVLVPRDTYIEFLPLDSQDVSPEGQQPLQAHEVEVGRQYEVVLTNTSGFYRYRMGDVIEIVGFFNQIPLVDFMFRTGQMLNVNMEKLSEASFTAALQSAVDGWPDVKVLDFTAAESVLSPTPDGQPPHYLVFIEAGGATPTQQQRQMIDEKLCEQHYVYKSFRVKNAIGPMKVMPVRAGTFSQFREQLLSGSSVFLQQFKQPRVLRTEQQVNFFMQHRIEQD